MILKKYLLTAFKEENKKKKSQKGNNFFWVVPVLGEYLGARQTNIFFKVGLGLQHSMCKHTYSIGV